MRENANLYSSFHFLSYFILAHVRSLNASTEFNAQRLKLHGLA